MAWLSPNIGAVEIRGDTVRLVVIRRGMRTLRVVAAAHESVEYTESEERTEALVAALRRALQKLSCMPHTWVLVVSSQLCMVRTLTLPFRGTRRVLAAAPFELEPHLAFPLEELALDFSIVAEFDGQTDVLAVGIRRNHLNEYLAVLQAVGIHVEAVTLDTIALVSFWLRTHSVGKGLQAVLHVREDSAGLVILHGRALAYFRSLPFSGQRLVSDPAAAAREIQNTLRAFLAKWRGKTQFEALYVSGLEPDEALARSLREQLGIEILLSDLLSQDDKTRMLRVAPGAEAEMDADAFVLVAAAEGAYRNLPVNFLRNEQQDGATLVGLVARHVMFTSSLALFLIGLWVFFYFQATGRYRTEVERLQTQIQAINAEIADLAEKGLGEDVPTDIFRDPPLLDILDEIAKRMPEGTVTITDVRLSPPGARGSWIIIEGTAPDVSRFNEAFARLGESPLLRVDPEPDVRLQGNIASFRIRCHRKQESVSNESA